MLAANRVQSLLIPERQAELSYLTGLPLLRLTAEIAPTLPAQPYGHVLLPLHPAMHPTPNATPHPTAAGISIHPQPGDELNAAIPTGNESLCYILMDIEVDSSELNLN
eukprot:gene14479-biopygen11595